MKKMMMALAALCVAGAASAVTVDWTYTNVINGAGPGSVIPSNSGDVGLAAGNSGTYAAHFTLGATVGNGILFSIGSPNIGKLNTGNRYIFSYTNGELTATQRGADGTEATAVTWSSGADVSLAQGEHTLGIAFSRTDGTTCTMTVMLDGNEVYSGSITIVSGPLGAIAWGSDFGTGTGATSVEYNEIGYYVDKTGTSGGILNADQIASIEQVPEPTALALLALGVAGLALRRKAA